MSVTVLSNSSKEMVNHPDHYTTADGLECIEVMEQIYGIEKVKAFCQLNAFKYQWRAPHKGNQVKDLEKAQWYLNKFISLSQQKETNK